MVRLACRVPPARAAPSGFGCRRAAARDCASLGSIRKNSRAGESTPALLSAGLVHNPASAGAKFALGLTGDTQRCCGARFQALGGDRLAAVIAQAIGACRQTL